MAGKKGFWVSPKKRQKKMKFVASTHYDVNGESYLVLTAPLPSKPSVFVSVRAESARMLKDAGWKLVK